MSWGSRTRARSQRAAVQHRALLQREHRKASKAALLGPCDPARTLRRTRRSKGSSPWKLLGYLFFKSAINSNQNTLKAQGPGDPPSSAQSVCEKDDISETQSSSICCALVFPIISINIDFPYGIWCKWNAVMGASAQTDFLCVGKDWPKWQHGLNTELHRYFLQRCFSPQQGWIWIWR